VKGRPASGLDSPRCDRPEALGGNNAPDELDHPEGPSPRESAATGLASFDAWLVSAAIAVAAAVVCGAIGSPAAALKFVPERA
jgi:hypothetical protein